MSSTGELIDSIDWAKLKNAYGSAIDNGGDLADLSSEDDETRRDAFETLRETLFAPSKLYSVAEAATKVLLCIVEHETVGRAEALCLVGDVLTGDHRTRPRGLDFSDPKLSQEYGKGRPKKLRSLVAKAFPTLLALLADPDADVRSSAAFLVSFVYDQRREACAKLREVLASEGDRLAQISQLFALRMLARYGDADAERTLQARDDGVAWLHRCEREPMPPKALAELLSFEDVLPWRCPWLGGDLSTALAEVSPNDRVRVTSAALEVLEGGEPRPEALPALLGLFFEPHPGLRAATTLTDEQRRVLELLSRDSLSDPSFAAHGLPMRAAARLKWLGLAPPGPLDAPTAWVPEGGEASDPLWRNLLVMARAAPRGLRFAAPYYPEAGRALAEAAGPALALAAFVAMHRREYDLPEVPLESVADLFAEYPAAAQEIAGTLAEEWGRGVPDQVFLGTLVSSTLAKAGAVMPETWFYPTGPLALARSAFEALSTDDRARAFERCSKDVNDYRLVRLCALVDLTGDPLESARTLAKRVRRAKAGLYRKEAKAELKAAAERCPELREVTDKLR